jgi:putative nucleotidyltransferase with HDIG domain
MAKPFFVRLQDLFFRRRGRARGLARKNATTPYIVSGTTSADRRRRMRRLVTGASASQKGNLTISPARAAVALVTVALLSALLCIHLWPNRVDLRLGDTANREIVAQRSVRFDDTSATSLLRDEALERVPNQYESIPNATIAATDSIDNSFDLIDDAANEISRTRRAASVLIPLAAQNQKPDLQEKEKAAQILETLGTSTEGLTIDGIAGLIGLTSELRQKARAAAISATKRSMGHSIADDGNDLILARKDVRLDTLARNADLDKPAIRGAILGIVSLALRPNSHYDARQTERLRQQAQVAVTSQMTRYAAGQTIIRPGERVTQRHLDAFAALGLQNARIDTVTVLVIVALVILMVSLVCTYLRRFQRTLYEDTSQLLLLSILTVVSVIGLKIGSTLLGLPFSGVHFGYLGMMCVASAGMVIALLLSPSVATLIVGLLSVASGLVLNNELRFTVITLGSSLVGIISVARLRNRGDLVRAAVLLCSANAILNVLVGQLEGDLPQELLYGAVWGIVSGLFALVLFWLGVALFEKPFGITTHLRLLELTDPATPVLQEFRLKVPGTYAHSLMVANLATAAAEAIGGDALLVRVAAYYHDLGKMNRPEFFIENQGNADNVHDRLSPSLSALILINHVKEGLEMAEGMGLPPRVREVIQQHHGTTLMKYFYHRASGGVQNATLEAQFRYPGPKPQTKEAAILMLADSVEAASRTLEKPTPVRVADFVARMVEDKRADGQLDECDLTMRDLRVIQELFVRTLCGTLHARIEYPGSPANIPVVPAAPALTLVAADPEEAILENLALNAPSDEIISPISLASLPALSETTPPHGDSDTNAAFPGSDTAEQSVLGTRSRRRRKPSGGV